MSSTDLALGDARHGTGPLTSAVVAGHVMLELVAVGASGGLPSRDLVGGVEVVGQALGVGVAHFPVGGETSDSLANKPPSALANEPSLQHGMTGGRKGHRVARGGEVYAARARAEEGAYHDISRVTETSREKQGSRSRSNGYD